MRAFDASLTAPHAVLIGGLLMLALLASRSLGMTLGALMMFFGALVHNALFVSLGALWAYATMPDKTGDSNGGTPRNA